MILSWQAVKDPVGSPGNWVVTCYKSASIVPTHMIWWPRAIWSERG